ncbi:MAG: SDR family oxidoreductase [Clostridia bacterium]|nr:SDR family oxidoreductase [Clostridia bacterium]
MKVLVTGSTQGIGKAIAEAFVKRGDEVIVHCSKDEEKAERVKREMSAYKSVICDLSDVEETEKLFEKTGEVDCLILNASVQYKNDWTKVTTEEFEKQINVNFRSSFLLMQKYIPEMAKKGFGRVVTIGSVNQYRNHPELTVYSATKCAVMSLVRNLAKQVAPYGVTVNNVAPGAILTPRNDSVYNDEDMRKKVESVIPAGKFGMPKDIVGAVLLLCSEEGAYITGADIKIDGGMSL